MNKIIDFENLEKKLGYKFKSRKYILTALTHSSYANEIHKESNERLEFLGDSVLSLIVSEYIFLKFKDFPEGKLTKLRAGLVCEKTLFGFSKTLCIDKFLIMSRGETVSGGNKLPSILADAFEAMVAAIFLDGGMREAKDFVLKFILPKLKNPQIQSFIDYKTVLQEFVQKDQLFKISYDDAGEIGPDHGKVFFVEVKLKNSKTSRI